MLAQRRYDRILHALRADGVVDVRTLTHVLGVSEATVRRDLGRLEQRGVVHRVRGGAKAATSQEPPYGQVAARPHADKEAVAAAAAGLVEDGDVLLLDIGTTVHSVAAHLHGRPVTVVTSNLAVYEELVADAAVELILLGGTVRRNYRSLVGLLTEQALQHVHAQRLFLGTSGVRPDGSVLDTTLVEVPVKQAMLRAADEVVLLADPGKFPGTGLARVCGPDKIHVLVCRNKTDQATQRIFADAGCRVVHA